MDQASQLEVVSQIKANSAEALYLCYSVSQSAALQTVPLGSQ